MVPSFAALYSPAMLLLADIRNSIPQKPLFYQNQFSEHQGHELFSKTFAVQQSAGYMFQLNYISTSVLKLRVSSEKMLHFKNSQIDSLVEPYNLVSIYLCVITLHLK